MKRYYFICYLYKSGAENRGDPLDIRNGVFEIEPPPKENLWRWEKKIQELAKLEYGSITVMSFQEM